ncbi:MAG: nucleoside triphosphate pyrophosphatase [Sinobacteraceae bacterium]|nr:nucleoside triphosphate pyrophosphatase [Nevskiaceae bacterium]
MSIDAASAQLYLASRSPRRAELLRQLGLRFETLPVDVVETPAPGQTPADYALATALAKALAAARSAPRALPVLGADTDVALDGEILGKPRDRAQGLAMLERLAGRVHEVYSAVAVVAGGRRESALSVTRVHFGPIRAEEAEAYWDSGEPVDKAGAYAIQGYAARWVKMIEGSYSGVVGLPLYETVALLERFGVKVFPRPVP